MVGAGSIIALLQNILDVCEYGVAGICMYPDSIAQDHSNQFLDFCACTHRILQSVRQLVSKPPGAEQGVAHAAGSGLRALALRLTTSSQPVGALSRRGWRGVALFFHVFSRRGTCESCELLLISCHSI